jgi:hypothetical protein
VKGREWGGGRRRLSKSSWEAWCLLLDWMRSGATLGSLSRETERGTEKGREGVGVGVGVGVLSRLGVCEAWLGWGLGLGLDWIGLDWIWIQMTDQYFATASTVRGRSLKIHWVRLSRWPLKDHGLDGKSKKGRKKERKKDAYSEHRSE